MPSEKPYRRTRNLFDPRSKTPFKLSRSRLENFIQCPRCFYLDRRLGVEPPGIPSFTLNSAVDALLKKEFDGYRRRRMPHPLMTKHGVEAIPFSHPMMDEWRETFKGVQFYHRETNLMIFGAVDDIWVDKASQLYVVDYKSTSTTEPITLEGEYRQSYKRQMEIYQWLLRRQNLKVADIGYFLYCNADKARDAFDATLKFDIEIISYKGNADWVESAISEAHKCLMDDHLPGYSSGCEYCEYRKAAQALEGRSMQAAPSNFQGELFQ